MFPRETCRRVRQARDEQFVNQSTGIGRDDLWRAVWSELIKIGVDELDCLVDAFRRENAPG